MRVTVVENEAGADLGFFAGWLAEAGVGCAVVRPHRGEAVPGRAEDGLIVLGGEAAAWEDERYPWLPATRALIRDAVENGLPTLGVCLGAQLMTLAFGGAVERGEHGLEIGVKELVPLPETAGDPLFHGLGPLTAVQYHGDAMTRLPEGAVRLVTGDLYPNQAYRLGDRSWAVQFHPEATPELFGGWTRASSTYLSELGHSAEDLNTEAKEAGERLAGTWRVLAERFAALVLSK